MRPTSTLSIPLKSFLESDQLLILDGGLATELEARGCDLSDDLWSARLLMDQPDLIRDVHLEYLRAGADCVVSASYQATCEGFTKRGLSRSASMGLIERSVDLAKEARDEFWLDPANRRRRLQPLVAASVGPYGAFLADGSEFRGDYGLDEEQLEDFHRSRWELLASSGADLLACETIPSRLEARALRRLLEATPGVQAWFSFSCGDGRCLSDGSPIDEVAAELESCPQVVAVGVNCTAPKYLSSLLERIRLGTSKPAVVYPNSGEIWDANTRSWRLQDASGPALLTCCHDWVRQGARLIGGCCRTRPRDIETLRRSLLG